MRLRSILAMAALAIPCCAQQSNKADVFSGQHVTSQLSALVQTARGPGSSGATLGDYKSHSIKLSTRTASGGAEVHAHYDDIFFVTGGKATMVTGGSVIHAKTDTDGETKGSRIENGKSETIAKGDVVHIPAGTPHQLILAPGGTYSSIVVKVRESSEFPSALNVPSSRHPPQAPRH
jgi:mannose-6-phosphate isomerase-like protein (cupin superfamily)